MGPDGIKPCISTQKALELILKLLDCFACSISYTAKKSLNYYYNLKDIPTDCAGLFVLLF
jgi:hypothetical protein